MAMATRLIATAFAILIGLQGCKTLATLGGVVAGASLNTVEVMTFNIFHDALSPADERNIPDWSGRREQVLGTIRSQKPDVVGLQEAYEWQVDWLISELPEYKSVGRGRNANGTGESVSIMYRKDRFQLLDSDHFWLSAAPDMPGSAGGVDWGDMDVPRIVTWVRLKRNETGKAFYLYNTHFASDGTGGPASRNKSALLLAERIAGRAHPTEYFFLTGDLNATEDEFPIRYLTGQERAPCEGMVCPFDPPFTPVKMIDAWRARHAGAGGTRCSNNSDSDESRIDYIMVWDPGPGVGIVASSISQAETIMWGPACASDHRAVDANIVIPLGGEQYVPSN